MIPKNHSADLLIVPEIDLNRAQVKKLLKLEPVQIALQCYKHIHQNEFSKYSALLAPRVIEKLGDRHKDFFTSLHNMMVNAEVELDYERLGSNYESLARSRKVGVHLNMVREGRLARDLF